MHRRTRLLAFLLSLLFATGVALPANASPTGWDLDDVGTDLDLRWIGVYRQGPNRVRVSITLWDPVRAWTLPADLLRKRQLYLTATYPAPGTGIYGQGYIARFTDDWTIGWIDSGSGQPFRHGFRVAHPNPYMFLVFLPAEVFAEAEFSVFGCESSKPFVNVPCLDSEGVHDQIAAG